MKPFLGFQTEENMALFTDLYELTMCASYFDNKKFESATFDLFIRRIPPDRSYFLFAGLEQVLSFLEKIKFTAEHLVYLRKQGFKEDFLEYLRNFRFTGDVYAVAEGSIVFPLEPLIRITAPIIEAQLVETFLLNTVNLQTMIATKASRVVYAAQGKPVIEFGLRREHGIDAGMKVARSSYLAGCVGTSNVLAGMIYDIPVFGTMAHSFIMSYAKEIDAFRAFAKTFPNKSTLLIDTYNEFAGAEKAAIVAKEMEKAGHKLEGVRLDSGDLVETSKKIRTLLDQKGLGYVTIIASGDLDEYEIAELQRKDAQIDGFGVGTKMGTSTDYPYIDVIYKLSEVSNETGMFSSIMKLSGKYIEDVIALTEEQVGGEPLLVKIMQNGKIICNLPSLSEVRLAAAENFSKLPEQYKQLTNAPTYPVKLSQALSDLVEQLKQKITQNEILNSKLN
jgi:nicotinate phosphoribosyltransferase